MTATALQAASSGNQYVTLGLGAEVFAIQIQSVSEILDMRPVAHVPGAPAFMVGLIDVRGRGVPVIDLRQKLGMPAVPPTEQTRILVLEATLGGKAEVIGLLVDRVFEVTELDDAHEAQMPDVGRRWLSDYIVGIGRRNGAFVIVFAMDRLLSDDEIALVTGGFSR